MSNIESFVNQNKLDEIDLLNSVLLSKLLERDVYLLFVEEQRLSLVDK